MLYSITHHTRHDYSEPVRESIMEARAMPRTEGPQRCLSFSLTTDPRARVLHYTDHLGNVVHHFDLPGCHQHLQLTAQAVVEIVDDFPAPTALGPEAWAEIDRLASEGDYWESLSPSRFVQFTPLLRDLAAEFNVVRRDDPHTLLKEISRRIHRSFRYTPQATRVDSPIDQALSQRQGVCQDYAHIMLALARLVGIPARYVSGYFFSGTAQGDPGATHAWVEALLPGRGWVGFDPSNDLPAGTGHIRVALGRDYADVPPTRGVFQGQAKSDVDVQVLVQTLQTRPEISRPPLAVS
ncbi:MAG: transglutaminase family protein [Verrucomicrobium sp.]|nr:transglutaminase family protein [Verrucomicrobium sp.]